MVRVSSTHPSLRAVIDDTLAGVKDLIAAFDDPNTPYLAVPRREKAPRYSDYAHLERIKEWLVGEEEPE